MPAIFRAGWRDGLTALLLLAPTSLAAQASAYLPLDDPRLPGLEYLITRGTIPDPSPMVRPFRISEALDALAAADTAPASRDAELVRSLRSALADSVGVDRWRAGARAGFQAYTHARRDPLHPAGAAGARPFAQADLAAVFGPVVAVSRPTVEPRLIRDPDWPGRRDLQVTGRMDDAYLSAQFRPVRLLYGQIARNWGPVGAPGIPISNYSYGRPEVGLSLGNRTIRLLATASELRDEADSTGAVIHRYFFAHRLGVRFSDRLHLALWETSVLAGPDRNFEGTFRNPVGLGLLTNAYGLGGQDNSIVGLDIHWRARRRLTLQAQLALDDIWYQHRDQNRDRWAFTLAAFGPFRSGAAWRVMYTQVSALALRTFNQFEDFTDAGVGLGRNFSDNDRLTASFTIPLRSRWLVTPELTFFRQGEGQINDPYPPYLSPQLAGTPALFIGTVERTWRAAVGVEGHEGPVDLSANLGFHHIVNAGHQDGVTRDRLEGRIQATVGLWRAGVFH